MKYSHVVVTIAAVIVGMTVSGLYWMSTDVVEAQEPNVVQATDGTLRFKSLDSRLPYDKRGASQITRAKIPGGWLVMAVQLGRDAEVKQLTFVPDPNHQWNGHSLP